MSKFLSVKHKNLWQVNHYGPVEFTTGETVWLVSHYDTSKSREQNGEDNFSVQRTQPRTLGGGKPIDKGWMGSFNNDNMAAEGKFKVVSIGARVVRFEEVEGD